MTEFQIVCTLKDPWNVLVFKKFKLFYNTETEDLSDESFFSFSPTFIIWDCISSYKNKKRQGKMIFLG